MEPFIILMFLGLFARESDEKALAASAHLPAWKMAALVVLPKVVLGALYWLACRMTLRRLGRAGGAGAMRWLDRVGFVFRVCVLGLFGLDLWIGLPDCSLRLIGHRLPLVDDLISLSPALALFAWAWSCYYAIDRRLREASLIGQLDAGLPAPVICTRGQYLLGRVRHQVLLVLLPLLAIRLWIAVIDGVPAGWPWEAVDLRPAFILGGVACIFCLTPLAMRHIWDTQPLPEGPLRESLLGVCRRHGVRVRELLLWGTFGGMVNAAVMGVAARVRYIFLTDALLELVPLRQIEAVMAHEVGHIRRHHLFWLLAAAAGLATGLDLLWSVALEGAGSRIAVLEHVHGPMGEAARLLANPTGETAVAVAGTLVCWLCAFGWVSRRFERQADTFAVQHLASQYPAMVDPQDGLLVDHQAVLTMTDALEQIALFDHMSITRNSWRHGSIRWRQDYLRGLIGRPVDDLPIDRQMFWINAASAAMIAGVIAMGVWQGG